MLLVLSGQIPQVSQPSTCLPPLGLTSYLDNLPSHISLSRTERQSIHSLQVIQTPLKLVMH